MLSTPKASRCAATALHSNAKQTCGLTSGPGVALVARRQRRSAAATLAGAPAAAPALGRGVGRRASAPRRPVVRAQAAAKKATFKSFEDMIEQSDIPVLVDFYATWCGPCQLMSGVLSEVAGRFGSKRLRVVKVDVDKYPGVASKYNVQGLPTLVLFKSGQPVDRVEGALQPQQLADRLAYFLAQG